MKGKINFKNKNVNSNSIIFNSQAEKKFITMNNETTNTQNFSKDLTENLKDSSLNLHSLNNKKLYSIINPTCKFCYEKEKKNDPLIIPCKCEGTIKYVHQSCIKKWIKNSNPDLFSHNLHCEICKSKFLIKIENGIYLNKKKLVKGILVLIIIFIAFIGLFFATYYILLSCNLINNIPKKKLIQSFIIFFILLLLFSIYPLYHFLQRNCYTQKKLDFEVLSIKPNNSFVKLSINNEKKKFDTNIIKTKNSILFNNFINHGFNILENQFKIHKSHSIQRNINNNIHSNNNNNNNM